MLNFLLLLLFLRSALGQLNASNQILKFAERHEGCPGTLTTSAGAPVEFQDTNNTQCERLILNEYFMDSMTHFVRERIPARVVHAKGGGAFGYFEVTHNITDICKAALFSSIGKRTPVAIRFSPVLIDAGGTDTTRSSRGYAVKFYTEKGNFDMVGINFPMFQLKDPILFTAFAHAQRRNAATYLEDANTFWDFLVLRPFAFFMYLLVFGDPGIPDGYRHMPGFSVHTYQIVNQRGERYFVRFHFIPDSGIKNLGSDEARNITGYDPDYFNRDLYNAIAKGNFPTWTVSLQVLTLEQVKTAPFNVFDITKVLPLKKYPLRPIGRICLDRNPTNYFAEIEQLAYSPGNLVPGIDGAPDKVFEARRLSYRDAANYRLGANHNKIAVNSPKCTKAMTYNRDGKPPVWGNGGDGPSYYPNSFNGPEPYVDNNRAEMIKICEDDSDNYEQAADLYMNQMTNDERIRLVDNIVYSLGNATKRIQDQAVYWFNVIHPDLGSRVRQALIEKSHNY